MPRKRRNSNVIATANQRIIGLTEVSADLDLGSGLTLAALVERRNQAQSKLDTYNALTVQLDAIANELSASEKELKAFTSRMLAGVRARYGGDSSEYEKAGGIRTSERKKPVRRTPA